MPTHLHTYHVPTIDSVTTMLLADDLRRRGIDTSPLTYVWHDVEIKRDPEVLRQHAARLRAVIAGLS